MSNKSKNIKERFKALFVRKPMVKTCSNKLDNKVSLKQEEIIAKLCNEGRIINC